LELSALFTALNIGAALLSGKNYNARTLAVGDLLDDAVAVYLAGNGRWAILLFADILQIAVLQVLIRVLPRAGLGQGEFALSVVATCAAIVLAVELLRFIRSRSRTADFCHRVVCG
jgi:hypothetical protein